MGALIVFLSPCSSVKHTKKSRHVVHLVSHQGKSPHSNAVNTERDIARKEGASKESKMENLQRGSEKAAGDPRDEPEFPAPAETPKLVEEKTRFPGAVMDLDGLS